MGDGSRGGSSPTIHSTVTFDEKHGVYEVEVAKKFDGDKPRMDLIDPYALTELAKVLTAGASKYDADNWRKGMDWSRIVASLLRHVNAFQQGVDTDHETGLSHMAHAMCNCMFLLWYQQHRKEFDDRYREVK